MNIILYTHSFLPRIGGRELVVHYLAKSLTRLGHNVRVLGPVGLLKYRHLRFDYKIHRYPSFFRGDLKKPGLRSTLREWELASILRLEMALFGCDVIHVHAAYPLGYIAAKVLGNHKRVPLIITPHGVDIHTIPNIGHGLRLNEHVNPRVQLALQQAQALTAISGSIEQSLLDAGADQSKIVPVANGVDIDRFVRKQEVNVREWLKLPADSRLIVTVGNYHPRKGQAILVQSMQAIVSREPRAHLLVIGRGTEALIPVIEELSLQNHVTLVGELAFPDIVSSPHHGDSEPDWLAAIHASSEIFVSAGMDEGSEGLSLAVLEAMAAKLGVVVTDISGNRDIIKHEKNGLLAKPRDPQDLGEKILRMLQDDNLRQQLQSAGLDTVSTYSWDEIAKVYVDVYEQSLKQCSGGKA